MNHLNEYKLYIQRIGLLGITNILIALSSLILLPIMTKNFSTGDYGVWVQINTVIGLIPNIATLGLPYTMVRFLSSAKTKKSIQEGFYSIAIMVFVSTFIISTLLFVFSKNVASALFNGNTELAMLLSIIVFLACLNALLINFFRTFQQMRKYSFFLLAQTYLGVFIISYFAIKGFGITMAVLGLLLTHLIIFLIMLTFIVSGIGFKIPKFKNVKEYLSFGLPTVPSNLSYWVIDSSDRFVIGILLSTTFVGYYSPGYTLGNVITLIIAPFTLLLPSLLPPYYDNNQMEKVKTFLRYSLKYFLLIAIPAAFGLSILSKQVLMILTTSEIALNGYLVTPFIALSAIIYGVNGIISNVLVLEKKTGIIGSIWIVTAILNLGLNIIFVPYLGIIGAALITLIAYGIAFVLTLFYSFKSFQFDLDLIFIIKSIIASSIMSILLAFINPNGILNIVIISIICFIIYLGLLLLLKGIKREEITVLRKMFLESS